MNNDTTINLRAGAGCELHALVETKIIELKNESLIDDEAFDMLNKLCNKLNNIEG